MGQVLEGRGGIPIKSTDDGKLWVHATCFSEEHAANLKGDGYIMPIDGVGTNGAEHICVIKNTDDRDLIVTAITLFVASYKMPPYVKVLLNETFVYAAGGTAVVPTNVKSGISGGAEGLFYTIAAGGTDITTFAGTSAIGGIYVFNVSPLTFSTDSGWVVPKNQVWSLYNTGNDNTYYGHISFYYHE